MIVEVRRQFTEVDNIRYLHLAPWLKMCAAVYPLSHTCLQSEAEIGKEQP